MGDSEHSCGVSDVYQRSTAFSRFNTICQTSHSEGGTEGNIIMPPVLARLKLADLLARVTPENLPDDADVSWGKPRGSEE